MADDTTTRAESPLRGLVDVLKDLVSLLRDLSILILAIMLIMFPKTLNNLLVDAGFEEGSFVGFKWKAKLVDTTDALQEAEQTIGNLQQQNEELLAALEDAGSRLGNTELGTRLAELEEGNRQLKITSQQVQTTVADTLVANAPLVEKARSSIAADAAVRYCYQEDRGEDGAQRYSVHCHASRDRCETARGPSRRWQQSPCEPVRIADAEWQPTKGGYMGSWYEFRSSPFPPPFPQIR